MQVSLEVSDKAGAWIGEKIRLVQAENGCPGLVGRFYDRDVDLTMHTRSNSGGEYISILATSKHYITGRKFVCIPRGKARSSWKDLSAAIISMVTVVTHRRIAVRRTTSFVAESIMGDQLDQISQDPLLDLKNKSVIITKSEGELEEALVCTAVMKLLNLKERPETLKNGESAVTMLLGNIEEATRLLTLESFGVEGSLYAMKRWSLSTEEVNPEWLKVKNRLFVLQGIPEHKWNIETLRNICSQFGTLVYPESMGNFDDKLKVSVDESELL